MLRSSTPKPFVGLPNWSPHVPATRLRGCCSSNAVSVASIKPSSIHHGAGCVLQQPYRQPYTPPDKAWGETGNAPTCNNALRKFCALYKTGLLGLGKPRSPTPHSFPTLSSPHLGGQGAPGHGAGLLHTPHVRVAAVQQTRQATGTVLVHISGATLCMKKQ